MKDSNIQKIVWFTSISGMNTTAGSYSLLGSVVPEDAGVLKRLRTVKAIMLGMPRTKFTNTRP